MFNKEIVNQLLDIRKNRFILKSENGGNSLNYFQIYTPEIYKDSYDNPYTFRLTFNSVDYNIPTNKTIYSNNSSQASSIADNYSTSSSTPSTSQLVSQLISTTLISNIDSVINRIVKGGYATDPNYGNHLRLMVSSITRATGERKVFVDKMLTSYKKRGLDDITALVYTAQDALESGYGKHTAGKHNYGGIKAPSGSTKVTHEYRNGRRTTEKLTFRNFNSEDDYVNYKINLLNSPRYNKLGGILKFSEGGTPNYFSTYESVIKDIPDFSSVVKNNMSNISFPTFNSLKNPITVVDESDLNSSSIADNYSTSQTSQQTTLLTPQLFGLQLSLSGQLDDAIKKWSGRKYTFGGTGLGSNGGIDCSAFVRAVWKEKGINLPRTARELYSATLKIDASLARYGDSIYCKNGYRSGISHTGIFLGWKAPGIALVAESSSSKGSGVHEWNLNSGYYKKHFAGFSRIV